MEIKNLNQITMKKILVSFLLIVAIFPVLKAQSDIDAFRFSQINREGTARFMGAGGALGAVGADFSAISVNPAAIAVFKKFELSLTPVAVSWFDTQSRFNGNSVTASREKYTLPQVGAVLKITLSRDKWQGLYFGFGYNRIQDFNGQFNVEGRSQNRSMGEELALNAINENFDFLNPNSLLSNFAYEAYLIDEDSTWSNSNRKYVTSLTNFDLKQSRYVETRGGIDEMSFTLGANYGDVFFMGASVGIPFLKYTEITTYKEEDDKNETSTLDYFEFNDNLKVNGVGFNLKLGIIYQPFSFMRVGIGFQTPTKYGTLVDKFERKMYAENDTGRYVQPDMLINEFKYSLTTPLRASFNLAFLINKRGFISLEYEITNFSRANMTASNYTFSEENKQIQAKYGLMHALRIGGEITASEHLLLRAGYNYLSSPYKKGINDGSAHVISAGLGARFSRFFFDLAYSLRLSKEKYWIYNADLANAADMNFVKHRVSATIGIKL
jgi:hypothetical protein